jgi:hypothetical protein
MTYTDRERYGTAVGAGRLRHRQERLASADTVAAAAIAGRHHPLGLALWRVRYGNDRGAYPHAQELLCAKVSNVARRRHWHGSWKVLKELTHQVLEWAVFGVCPHCAGRGLAPVDGVPTVLSDDPCDVCHGDGSTPIEKAVPVHLIGRAKDIHQLIVEADEGLGRAMREAMSR